MSREQYNHLRNILLGIGVGVFIVFLAFSAFLLKNRYNLVTGCIRNHQTVIAPNAEGWRAAERARRASYAKTQQAEDLAAANTYARIAASMEHTNSLSCHKLYPFLPTG